MKSYPNVTGNPDFPSLEREVLRYWDDKKIFEKSIQNRAEDKCFVFYDGPPFANGLPHYGHLLTGFLKDTVARYNTMRGFRVNRRFGWDCHGLPAEMLAEKELGVSGKANIESFGIEKFNEHCRTSVMKFTEQWKSYVTRQGRWVDFENGYRTMDKDFMESVLWAFHELWSKGLIYESIRVVPYSWACQTPLSNFETKMDNAYREKVSKTATVKFQLSKKAEFVPPGITTCKILAWTTTPWTLVSNFALAINTNITYVGVIAGEEMLVFSESYLEHFEHHCKKRNLEYVHVTSIPGSQLLSLQYEPLFPYFTEVENAFCILNGDFVSEKEGTGIVHIAPGFGEEDFFLCKKHNIPSVRQETSCLLSTICPIDDAGRFTATVREFADLHVFEASDGIIKNLKERGLCFEVDQYTHNYPHCWRTDTPLIYRAMSSWYVEVTKLKARMEELNTEVNWIPKHIQRGQFGKWLEGVKDWSISRNRFWGTPVPVWKSDDNNYPRVDVYGSIKKTLPGVKALEEDFGPIEDLHLPYIDDLTRPNPDDPTGKSMMRRVPDVLDCWFESGSMPYAQVHYPFENKEQFEKNFPADFITEYIAQTRGWFYTLFVLSTGIFDRQPFKTCICHGVILDIKGQKLSKRLNNYPDPMEMFEKYGSDSVRFMMLSQPVSTGEDLLLDQDGNAIREVLKSVIKPIWSSYSFFTVYANSDQVRASLLSSLADITSSMDQYILYECVQMINVVVNSMESIDKPQPYDIRSACSAIVHFSDKLNNWYIRRCRERFWSKEKTQDKLDAYDTLYTVLHYLTRVAAPFLPFAAEQIWLGLDFPQHKESVHLEDFPAKDALPVTRGHAKNAQYMQLVMDVCRHALSLRNTHNLRVRQPLKCITLYPYCCDDLASLPAEYKQSILSEVNAKSVDIKTDIESVASFELKLNFPLLGKRNPSKVKQMISLLKAGVWEIKSCGSLLLGKEDGEHCIVQEDEFTLNLKVHNEYACQISSNGTPIGVLCIDHVLTKDLILEGIARDIVRVIQQTRKEHQLEMLDRAEVAIHTDNSDVVEALKVWAEYIKKQTLSDSLSLIESPCDDNKNPEGKDFSISLLKSRSVYSDR